ncbi:MAG: FlgD immunoglobulin-like domain containing protein [bacterium]
MNSKTTSGFLIACCLSLTAFGFLSFKKSKPEALGLFQAKIDEPGLLQLAIDQVRQALRTGNLQMFRAVLAEEFDEPRALTHLAGNRKLSFFKKSDLFESLNARSMPNIELRTQKISFEGDQAVVVTKVSPATSGSEKEIVLTFKTVRNQWKLQSTSGLFASLNAFDSVTSAASQSDFSDDTFELYSEKSSQKAPTLIHKALSRDHGIDKLTRAVTKERLGRTLFQKPYAGVLVSSVTQLNEAPFFTARYAQLVTDPAWNRIIYGDYDGWIKAYGNRGGPGDLNRPHGIDRDADGRVYVADTGNNRIVVLSLRGKGEETQLHYQFDFGNTVLNHPYDVAWDDAGTPFDGTDDIIWVADTGNHRIVGFTLQEENTTLRYTFGEYGRGEGGFFSPKAITPGRFNGVCTNSLYVADTGNRRIVELSVNADGLHWQNHYESREESQLTSIDVDHWGNLYVTDRSYCEVQKLTADLQPLAVVAGTGHGCVDPVNVHVIFGQVSIAAEARQIWSGYDQAFVLERWSETSGAERYQLGLQLQAFKVTLSQDLDHLAVHSKLTDHGKVSLALTDEQTDHTVRQIPLGWLVPGVKRFTWDRRDDIGWQVRPGFYRLQLSAQSSYGTMTALEETPAFYLPLYYHEDSGSDIYHDAHLVQGVRSQTWGTEPHETIAKHPSEVVYRFTELNPAVQYEMSAEFFNKVGDYLKQRITVDETRFTDDFEVQVGRKRVEWQPLPGDIYSDGEIEVRVSKIDGEGDAMISQLWLREANYDPANPPVQHDVDSRVPKAFSLEQNYPNPFNPSTTIEFGVPAGEAMTVNLKIFNALGQTVKVLVNEKLQPGRHSVVWNGRDASERPIASGVYFYQLSAGQFVQVMKLVLMK